MSDGLMNLGFELLNDESSFDDVKLWLNSSKDNQGLLINAALYYFVAAKTPSNLVKRPLQLAADMIKTHTTYG
jgi:hypothetical protein